MKQVEFFKHVGGYETYAKIRGRWYLVCSNEDRISRDTFFEAAEAAGVELVRTGNWPTPVSRAWREHGAKFSSVEAALPRWTEKVGF